MSVLHVQLHQGHLYCMFQSHLKFKYTCREQPSLLSFTCRLGPLIRGPLLPTPDRNSGTHLSTDVQGHHTWFHFPDHTRWRPTSHTQCRQEIGEMAGENRTLSHTPEGKGDGDKKRGTQCTGSQKCQRRTRYVVSAWHRVTLERPVWCWIVWIEQFLWINAQYFLTINDKANKTQHLSDLLVGCSLENFLTFIFSPFQPRKIKKFDICSSLQSTQ